LKNKAVTKMKKSSALLAQRNETGNIRGTFRRKSRVRVPSVGISPTTLKIMEENEQILKKYGKKSSQGQ
jgi:stage II sporulation protein SB